MKLIQFVYPMFLVALGLHTALLFVPIGGTSEEVIEDVDLADLPETKAPAKSSLDPLPVPDPNVPAPEPPKGDRLGANSFLQPAANSANVGVTRPVVTTIARRSPSTQPTAPPESPPAGSTPPASDTDLPDLPADSDQNSEESMPTPAAADNNTGNSPQMPASDLIASAEAKLPASLRAMVTEVAEALTYREAGTSKAIADQNREAWKAKIRTQANVDTIENIAPTQVANLTQVSYPIQSAEAADVLSYSACLEKDPHSAEVGVLFDSQGNVAGDPELIRSTGYGALNEEILATFADVDNFSNLGEALDSEHRRSKAYTFEVAVDYKTDACVSLEKLQPASENSGG